jgi:hypothetical protein
MKPTLGKPTLITAPELAKIIGTDMETINNWIRRGVISRVPIGGRQLKARLFSIDEVYKAALISELVRLGIQPSPASDVANVVWKEWEKKDVAEAEKVYAMVGRTKGKWTAVLRSHPVGRQSIEVELRNHAFTVIPISDIFEYVSRKMSALLGD